MLLISTNQNPICNFCQTRSQLHIVPNFLFSFFCNNSLSSVRNFYVLMSVRTSARVWAAYERSQAWGKLALLPTMATKTSLARPCPVNKTTLIHDYSSPIIPEYPVSQQSSLTCNWLSIFYSSPMISPKLSGEGVWYRCLIYGWALHRHLLSPPSILLNDISAHTNFTLLVN